MTAANKTTAATAKAPNYTPEQTAMLEREYIAGGKTEETVETLAIALGRTTRSVIAKLSRMGIYTKKERTSKNGDPVQKKDVTADAIGAILRMTEAEIESLTKANKTALKKIFDALAMSKPLDGQDSAE